MREDDRHREHQHHGETADRPALSAAAVATQVHLLKTTMRQLTRECENFKARHDSRMDCRHALLAVEAICNLAIEILATQASRVAGDDKLALQDMVVSSRRMINLHRSALRDAGLHARL